MSLYAVKNDEGKWLGCEIYCDEPDWFDHGGFIWDARSIAEENVKLYGGHVIELVDAPVKVVVSEDMASWLSDAKEMRMPIEFLARCKVPDGDQEDMLRAYVNGWTVEKTKRYLIKVPHTDDSYFYKIDDEYCNAGDSYHLEGMTDKKWFTLAEIEHYELTDCDKVLCADSARTTGEVKD